MKLIKILESLVHGDYKFSITNNPMFRGHNEPEWEGYNGELTSDNDIVGWVNLIRRDKTDNWFINGFSIFDKFKGKKLGNLLMVKMLDFAKNKGIKNISLSVYSDNIPALKVYQNMGFKIIDQSDNVTNMELNY